MGLLSVIIVGQPTKPEELKHLGSDIDSDMSWLRTQRYIVKTRSGAYAATRRGLEFGGRSTMRKKRDLARMKHLISQAMEG